MARPKTNIDWIEMGRLVQAGCTGVMCAAYIGIDDETFYNRCKDDLGIGFTEFLRTNRAKGDALLLAKQYEAALKDKDRGMLIWLGKNRLGQTDRQAVDVTTQGEKITPPIQWVDGDTE
jgi:hypothetical protein